jgi:hypothetical protein
VRSIVAQKSQTTLYSALRQLRNVTIQILDDLDVPCRIIPNLNGIVVNPALMDGDDLDGQLLAYVEAAAKQLAPRPSLTAIAGDAEPGQPGQPAARPALRLVRE